MQSIVVDFPCEPEPLDSPFYINRPPVEETAYKEITKPGSLLRIQAPKKMGKTSLVLRLLNYAKQLGYRTVYLDFQQVEEGVCVTLDKFLRWFCSNISIQLNIVPKLDEYWYEDIGSKMNCTFYVQNHLLGNIDSPLVLVLNEVNRIFEYSPIIDSFLSLLRSWHEQGKHNENWRQLRLVVVHSTEVYINLNINHSPFNVGQVIKLPEFNITQIQDLAQRHGLDWTNEIGIQNTLALQAMVGGHPYLVRLALYHMVNCPGISLALLLEEAPTLSGIYHAYLRQHLVTLQQNPELALGLKQLITTGKGVELDHIIAYKLESMGLIKLQGNQCTISCDLYRLYFSNKNIEEQDWYKQIEKLQKQNQELQRLCSTDELTQVANRRSFEAYLDESWQTLILALEPLSLILLEIDYFGIYNSTRGQALGDECLRQVANTIRQVTDLFLGTDRAIVARYTGVQFAMLLPKTEASRSVKIAETIREQVKLLGIKHDEKIDGLPARVITVSLGIACTIPQTEASPSILVKAAEEALEQANRNRRDHTYVSQTLNYGFRGE